MPLEKQSIQISFDQGLQNNVDPLQLPAGKMLDLVNSVFTKQGLLTKRNGYKKLPLLPDSSATTLTTYSDTLLSIGNSIQLYSENIGQWINKGNFDPVSLSVMPLVRSAYGQTVVDVATAPNGLACSVYKDTGSLWSYQISDTQSGQVIVSSTQLPSTATLARVFTLGDYFIITFLATVGTTHLQYISIPQDNPTNASAAKDLSTQAKSLTASYDGVVSNHTLYLALNGSDVGGAIRITSLDSNLVQHSTSVIASQTGDLISLLFDQNEGAGNLYIVFSNSALTNVYVSVYSAGLVSVIAPTVLRASTSIVSFTGTVINGSLSVFYQYSSTYSYSSTRSDYIQADFAQINYSAKSVSVSSSPTVIRSVGLASKAFYHKGTNKTYFLSVYGGVLQPTYFLVDQFGNSIARLSYQNAFGYPGTAILPQANMSGDQIQIGYLYKSLVVPVNTAQGVASANGIYNQSGINLVTFNLNSDSIITSQVAGALHLTGGQYYHYDGLGLVEHGFHVFPEDIGFTTSAASEGLTKQIYYYYFVYEWTDSQGLIHRSSPSVPLKVDLTLSGSSTNTNTLNVPTLRLTQKKGYSPVRIVGYRWSAGQQVAYQFTSISSPTLNDVTIDSVQITDSLADSSILGNVILYTTGNVVSNSAPPATKCSTLYKNRLVLIDAENPNRLWISKRIIAGEPVDFSSLLVQYYAPSFGNEGGRDENEVIAAMDDKLIISKKTSLYYVVGNGPDDTGQNNDLSDPTFITNSVGSDNPKSFVLIPQGMMFQSDKGIWLLGRDLSIKYIGAPVCDYNKQRIMSACLIPGTTQVRFALDSGITLLYDYFFDQWGTFKGLNAGSSTLYKGLHTYLNSRGEVYQETIGKYLDGSIPVCLSFTTAWIKLTGLQGFQRAYFFYLLGKYLSPHKLVLSISYDGDQAILQQSIISPDNYSSPWGMDDSWGSMSPWGGPSSLESWKVPLDRQKCESIRIRLDEIFDPSFGTQAQAGVELSGINLIIGAKSGYPRRSSSRTASS